MKEGWSRSRLGDPRKASAVVEREARAMDLSAKLEVVADGLVTVREAVAFLQLSRATIYELMATGELPFVKLGRSRRIPRRALLELAAAALSGGRTP